MPRFHDIWDNAQKKQVRIKFTAEEEIQRDAEEVLHNEGKPMRDWLMEIEASDGLMSRSREDALDHLIEFHDFVITAQEKINHDEKKAIRDRKP